MPELAAVCEQKHAHEQVAVLWSKCAAEQKAQRAQHEQDAHHFQNKHESPALHLCK